MMLRGASGLLALVASLAAVLVFAAGSSSARPPGCQNGVMFVRGPDLVRLDDATNRYVQVAHLPVLVNALGYAPDQGVFYGISGSNVVTIDPAGVVTVRGPAPSGTSGAYAGAVAGTTWYVRSGGALRVVSIDPASPEFLHVIRSVPVTVAGELGDFDIGADGRLYGIATGGAGPGRVLRIDPTSGDVTVLASPAALPGSGSYGGVVIRDGVLTAALNDTGALYSMPLASPDHVTTTSPPGTAPSTSHADAAACPIVLPTPTPTPTRTPTPRPTRTPTPRPKPTHRAQAPPPIPPSPKPMPTPTAAPTKAPAEPTPSLKPAAHLAKPWHPVRRTPLTWTVALLMVIPAAAATRVAGKSLHRRR